MSSVRHMPTKQVTSVAAALALLTMAVVGTGGSAVAQALGHDAGATVAGTISTVAGGVGGPGKATALAIGSLYAGPCGVSYSGGHLLVADGFTVRSVSTQTDWMTTPAGTGTTGPPGDGGPARGASLESCATAADHSGNLVIADHINNRIRVVAAHTGSFYGQPMTAGDIYTIAGTGTAGFAGDGGPAASAELNQPTGLALDGAGNLVIADGSNNRVRVVAEATGSFYGQAMTVGDIYTVAGGGTSGLGDGGPGTQADLNFATPNDSTFIDPNAVAVDRAGNLVIADSGDNRVRVVAARTGKFYGRAMAAGDIYTVVGNGTGGFAGDGGPGVKAALDHPCGLAVDGVGNVAIADEGNNRVRMLAAAPGQYYGRAMTAGNIYTVAGNGTGGFAGDGGPASRAELSLPDGVAVDGAGNLVIADTGGVRLRVVAAGPGTYYGQPMALGNIYTVAGNGTYGFAGDGGPVTKAELSYPRGVAVDQAGNLVIADSGNGRVRVVAQSTGTFYGQAMQAGYIYTVAGGGGGLGDGGPATRAALGPDAVAVDGAGNLVICDETNMRVRVVAVRTGTFYGQAMTAGNIYSVAGNGGEGFSGDGGPGTSAELNQPADVAVDRAGNLVIADYGNSRVRVLAGRTGTFYGQAMTAGNIYTVAGNSQGGFSGDGGPATLAGLWYPEAVATDHAGNLVIADSGDMRVRVVAESTGTFYGQAMTAGDIYTVAGDGRYGFSGDGGPATKAELFYPEGLAVDGTGNLILADGANERIRVVAESTGSFYGQAMTTGDIYTIGGDGTSGFAGDGGPATSAELSLGPPDNLAVDGAGNVLIPDEANGRIREVTG